MNKLIVFRKMRAGTEHKPGLEVLFMKYGVDLGLWGHYHQLARMYPVYNRTVYNSGNPYHNPRAPVHMDIPTPVRILDSKFNLFANK